MTRLQRERRKAHLSQVALAQKAGVHVNTISRVERGFPPSQDVADRLARALSLPPASLFPVIAKP